MGKKALHSHPKVEAKNLEGGLYPLTSWKKKKNRHEVERQDILKKEEKSHSPVKEVWVRKGRKAEKTEKWTMARERRERLCGGETQRNKKGNIRSNEPDLVNARMALKQQQSLTRGGVASKKLLTISPPKKRTGGGSRN